MSRQLLLDDVLHARQQQLVGRQVAEHGTGDADRRQRIAQFLRHRRHERRLPRLGALGGRQQFLRGERAQHQAFIGLAQLGYAGARPRRWRCALPLRSAAAAGSLPRRRDGARLASYIAASARAIRAAMSLPSSG